MSAEEYAFDETNTGVRSAAVEWLEADQISDYHLIGLFIPDKIKKPFREHRLATVGGVALTLTALAGYFVTNGEVQLDPRLSDGVLTASVKKFEFQSDILAGTGTFADQSGARLDVGVAIKPPVGPTLDKIVPDYDSRINADCSGEFQVIVPPAAIERRDSGSDVVFDVDMPKVKINAYRPQACIPHRDDDDERLLYQLLNPVRDTLVKLPFIDDNDVRKPDEVMNDIDEYAAATLSNKALAGTIDTCAPKLKSLVQKAVKQGVPKMAASLSGEDASKFSVNLVDKNDINWHTKNKTIQEIQQKYVQYEAKIDNFNFDKKATCSTAGMKVQGESKK